jgi:chemotaxis protein methyltransferase CheR
MSPSPRPELSEVARVLAEAAGISLGGGLDRALERGLAEAAAALGEDPAALARRVAAGDREAIAALVEHAAVGETSFWRHPAQLAALGRLAAAAAGPLTVWSAGCATGEEPYSVAIALLEAGRAGRGDRVVATDLSDRALAAARVGLYGPRALRNLPPAIAARWFDGGERVAEVPRRLVSFAHHNLVSDPPPPGGPFDVVFCRNVLIYFDSPTAVSVLYRLADALRPGGALVLGPVELPLAAGLEMEWVDDQGATLLVRPR